MKSARPPSTVSGYAKHMPSLVDNDRQRYTNEILRRWKTISESAALRSLENTPNPEDEELLFLRLEQLMPDLLEEIRKDLTAHPLCRKFVPLKKALELLFWRRRMLLLLRRAP